MWGRDTDRYWRERKKTILPTRCETVAQVKTPGSLFGCVNLNWASNYFALQLPADPT